MTQSIESRIYQLKEDLDNQRQQIIGINEAILNDGFIPNKNQQVTIDYIRTRGKEILSELEKLGLKN